MTTRTQVDERTMGAELDRAFGALGDTCRRIVVEELTLDGPVALEELANRIADRRESWSVSKAELALVHVHLPRLEDENVVAFDRSKNRIELDEASTVRTVLTAAREQLDTGQVADGAGN